MKQFWTLLAVCAGLLVLPTAASAQNTVPPPGGDNLADAIPVRPSNSPFLPLTPGVLGFGADTTNYTTEAGEFDACGQSTYGKTIWSVFATDRTGRIDVTAAGYDSVLALLPVNSQGAPTAGPCTDRLAGRIESFPRDNLPTVKKGGVYAVQVGGFRDASGNFAGGQLEVDFELLPPERVEGDAILTWRSARGGIKVTSVKVSGPRGGAAGIRCLRKSCGRQQIIRNTSPKVIGQPIAKLDPSGRANRANGKLVPAAKEDATVRYASSTAFKGRTVKNGSRLLVLVLAEDQIGAAFFWDVKNNAAGTKTLGCVEPEGSAIQRRGTCDGR